MLLNDILGVSDPSLLTKIQDSLLNLLRTYLSDPNEVLRQNVFAVLTTLLNRSQEKSLIEDLTRPILDHPDQNYEEI